MKVLKLIVLIIALIPYNQLIAQKFETGKVFLLNGDTLQGSIKYENWNINPKSISFIEANKTVQVYNTQSIKGFAVNDEIYLSAIVEAENSIKNSGGINLDSEISVRIDTVFLQSIYLGSKSLSHYKDPQGRTHYYIGNQPNFILLKYKKYQKFISGGYYSFENKTFHDQLKKYFVDRADLKILIDKIGYNKNDMKKIFESYYNSGENSTQLVYTKRKETFKFNYGIALGYNNSAYRFEGKFHPWLSTPTFNSTNHPSGGIFIDLIIPRYKDRLSIYNELFYSGRSIKGSYSNYVSDDQYSTTETNIQVNYLKLLNAVKYSIPVGKVDLTFKIGITTGSSINTTNKKIVTSTLFTTTRVDHEPGLVDFRKLEQALLMGTGIRMKQVGFEWRHERGNGISNNVSLASKSVSNYFLLNYTF